MRHSEGGEGLELVEIEQVKKRSFSFRMGGKRGEKERGLTLLDGAKTLLA